ncbi:MAG TPA: cyclic peptide export ABC transporter [Xanthobacteraceae bacterium]|nr:cyclic peptide export ABC transporter [Xanthobacteraceae bacterium]
MRELFRFLQAERALVHSRVLPLSVTAGLSRGLLIMLINAAVLETHHAGLLAAAAFGVLAIYVLSLHFSRVAAHQLVERVQCDLRSRLVRRLLHVAASFFFGRESGEIYNVLANDVATIASSSVRVLNSLQSAVLIAFCILYLFWLSPLVGVTAVATIALGAGACVLWDRAGRIRLAKAHREVSAFFDRLQDTLHGFKELRLHDARRSALEAHVGRLLAAIRKLLVGAEHRFSLSHTTAQTFMFLQLGVIVFALPAYGGMDSATAFQVLTVVLFAYGPVDSLLGSYPSLARARVSLERLQALETELGRAAPPLPAPSRTTVRPDFETLTLDGVVVSLTESAPPPENEEGRFTVGPINLTIRRGEIVFIHGGNGSGKTTLLTALCGLRQAESGRILIDGDAVDTRDGGGYSALFSAVFADFHLFRHPYGLADGQVRRLIDLLPELDLPKRVEIEDGRFQSLSLSAGQRRRLALAVALAEERPILLFDEFAADQDPAHRAFFYEMLLPELRAQGRTVVAITHDENRFHLCDQLVKMDQGRVVAVQRGRLVAYESAAE